MLQPPENFKTATPDQEKSMTGDGNNWFCNVLTRSIAKKEPVPVHRINK